MTSQNIKTAIFAAILGIAQGIFMVNYTDEEEGKQKIKEQLDAINTTLQVNTAAVAANTNQLVRMESSERETLIALTEQRARINEHERRLDNANL